MEISSKSIGRRPFFHVGWAGEIPALTLTQNHGVAEKPIESYKSYF